MPSYHNATILSLFSEEFADAEEMKTSLRRDAITGLYTLDCLSNTVSKDEENTKNVD